MLTGSGHVCSEASAQLLYYVICIVSDSRTLKNEILNHCKSEDIPGLAPRRAILDLDLPQENCMIVENHTRGGFETNCRQEDMLWHLVDI